MRSVFASLGLLERLDAFARTLQSSNLIKCYDDDDNCWTLEMAATIF